MRWRTIWIEKENPKWVDSFEVLAEGDGASNFRSTVVILDSRFRGNDTSSSHHKIYMFFVEMA